MNASHATSIGAHEARPPCDKNQGATIQLHPIASAMELTKVWFDELADIDGEIWKALATYVQASNELLNRRAVGQLVTNGQDTEDN